MTTYVKEIEFETHTQFEIRDITKDVQDALSKSKVRSGIAVVFSPHTTAAIRINHDEALLKQDIMKMLYRLVPVDINYGHDFFEIRTNAKPDERSNGHAHVKAFLLGDSETIPVDKGKMLLGDRQSIFFVELDGGRKRSAIIQIFGE
jgi:secondary thiamine-phosphate synthase enzyme